MPFPVADFDLHAHERTRVVHLAEAAIDNDPRTITSAVNPRSAGGKNDFSSEGDYWWPDPANPDGPYIQRDGQSNPDNFIKHRELMLDMASDVGALAAAYKITGDERFAAAAVRHLRTWFVTPATRMNPNLQYAQAIKGRHTGRGIGIIDTLHLAEVALAVDALRPSDALSKADDEALSGWFRDYLHWMRTHQYGIDERDTTNNHAVCWVLQCATFAVAARDEEVLADSRRRLKEILLPMQMAPNDQWPDAPLGSFPRELGRTKPYGYSIFNLDVMAALAHVLSTPEENLVTWSLPNGRSVVKGIEFLTPYLVDKATWLQPDPRYPATPGKQSFRPPYKQDVEYWHNWPVRQSFLLFGALATSNAEWLEFWTKLDPDPTIYEVRRNFPIRQPVLWVTTKKAAAKPAAAAGAWRTQELALAK